MLHQVAFVMHFWDRSRSSWIFDHETNPPKLDRELEWSAGQRVGHDWLWPCNLHKVALIHLPLEHRPKVSPILKTLLTQWSLLPTSALTPAQLLDVTQKVPVAACRTLILCVSFICSFEVMPLTVSSALSKTSGYLSFRCSGSTTLATFADLRTAVPRRKRVD